MAHDWQETDALRPRETNRAQIQRRITERTRRQRQLIRLEQLEEIGLGRRAVRHRVAARSLHRLHPAVFALHPPPYSRQQRWLAAVYAGGPGSLLSDLCAATHLGIWEEAPPLIVHITNESGRGRTLRGITAHRRRIQPCDRLIVAGIPCTSATRTVVDCAAALDEVALESLLLAADAKRTLNRRRMEELLTERPRQPGTGRLRRLITEDPVESRSRNERRMFRICRRLGIPRPVVNLPLEAGGRNFIADFCWPGIRLIVEADSWRWHGGRLATESDRDRDQLLNIAGWRVVHFTRSQIKHYPDEVGRRLVALTTST